MMIRRDFLKLGVGGSMLSLTAAAEPGQPALDPAISSPVAMNAPPVLRAYTQEDQRRRLENIRYAESAVRQYLRKQMIANYLPAQACYSLGEYPSQTRWEPNAYDEQELDRLRDHGIQIIQVFDEWNDSLRLFGGHKLCAVNPEGFRRFVGMVHQRGMKILPYVSTGFIQRTDPDFRAEWAREADFLVLGYWNMARCSPASPGWRAYVLPRILSVLDDYGADGLYDDGGYLANVHNGRGPATSEEVLAFEETPDYDGAFTDLLALVYGEVKRRGGIFKLHVNAAEQPMSRGLRVYDYLWTGEGVGNLDAMRETTKAYPAYVVPCPDMTFASLTNPDEPFLQAIPYLQFPILHGGRPFTGERGFVPGVAYSPNPDDFWMRLCREAREQYKAHPEGPYSYSPWDAIPAQPEARPTHARWLKQYLAMAEEGAWVWMEVRDGDLLAKPLPDKTVVSLFAGREVFAVLANYAQESAEIVLRDAYLNVETPNEPPQTVWNIPGRRLLILRKTA